MFIPGSSGRINEEKFKRNVGVGRINGVDTLSRVSYKKISPVRKTDRNHEVTMEQPESTITLRNQQLFVWTYSLATRTFAAHQLILKER